MYSSTSLLGRPKLVQVVPGHILVDGLTTEVHEGVHSPVAAHRLGEVEVNVSVVGMSSQCTHRELLHHRAIVAE